MFVSRGHTWNQSTRYYLLLCFFMVLANMRDVAEAMRKLWLFF